MEAAVKTAAWAIAALALALGLLPGVASAGAGWYLLAPPLAPVGGTKEFAPDTGAMLREWKQRAAFDTAVACETARVQRVELAWKAIQAWGPMPTEKDSFLSKLPLLNHFADQDLRCIASDDPRLGAQR